MANYLITGEAVQTQEAWDRVLCCPMDDCRSLAVEQYGVGVHDTYSCLACGMAFFVCLQSDGAWLVTTLPRYTGCGGGEARGLR